MKREYDIIKSFYGDQTAKRSGVPLMNHIDEGLQYLKWLHASEKAKAAWCLHPIVQNGVPFDLNSVEFEVIKLAEEYRDKANAYLCKPSTDYVDNVEAVRVLVGDMSLDCRQMLIADKMQNKKDFTLHHRDHPRFKQLELYFTLWMIYLTKGVAAMPRTYGSLDEGIPNYEDACKRSFQPK